MDRLLDEVGGTSHPRRAQGSCGEACGERTDPGQACGTRAFTRSTARCTVGRVATASYQRATCGVSSRPTPAKFAAPQPAEMRDVGHRERVAGDEGPLGQHAVEHGQRPPRLGREAREARGCGSEAWRWKKPAWPKAGPSPEAWKNSCSNTRARSSPAAGKSRPSSRRGRPRSQRTRSGPDGPPSPQDRPGPAPSRSGSTRRSRGFLLAAAHVHPVQAVGEIEFLQAIGTLMLLGVAKA